MNVVGVVLSNGVVDSNVRTRHTRLKRRMILGKLIMAINAAVIHFHRMVRSVRMLEVGMARSMKRHVRSTIRVLQRGVGGDVDFSKNTLRD